MATERVLEVPIRRHVIESERTFADVLDGIFGGISQPDIGPLFSDLEASTSYEQFSSLVRQAQGSSGLMRFWQLHLDVALTLDPQAPHQARHPELPEPRRCHPALHQLPKHQLRPFQAE